MMSEISQFCYLLMFAIIFVLSIKGMSFERWMFYIYTVDTQFEMLKYQL